jgi:hypothetical protein
MRPRATYKIFSGAVMTGTNVLVSVIIDTWMIDVAGIEFQWNGNPSGGFVPEASNQYDPGNNPNPTFVPLGAIFTPALANPVAGSNPSQICSLSGTTALPFRYLRLRYTNTAGSGVLDAWLNQSGAA